MRWRSILEFSPYRWADKAKTQIKYVHPKCNSCRRREQRIAWAKMTPAQRERRREYERNYWRRRKRKLIWVPTAPLREWLMTYVRYSGVSWDQLEAASGVDARQIYRLREESQRIEIDTVDRLLTVGLGRPDVVSVLYPGN